MARLGYWVDLAGVNLSDQGEAASSWVHALSVGKFEHPIYGTVDVSSSRIARFAENVKKRVRGIDPSINYDHINMGDAAGWVKDAEARQDGLWLFVEWTRTAATKIKEKAYRYFSAEFDDEWKDPKSRATHKDVLFGGALTNRPFLKDLVPVNLSELAAFATPNEKEEGEGEGMDPKDLRTMLGLAENATDDDVKAKIKALTESPAPTPPAPQPAPPNPPTPAPPSPPAPSGGQSGSGGTADSGDTEPADVNKLLAELVDTSNNPAVRALGELIKTQQAELTKMHTTLHEQAIEKKLSELDELAKEQNIAIPQAVHDQLKAILMNSPQKLGEMTFKAYVDTIKMGVIELGERGWQRRVSVGSPGDRFEEKVKELMQHEKGLDYADALERVAALEPQLYNEYREESFAGRE